MNRSALASAQYQITPEDTERILRDAPIGFFMSSPAGRYLRVNQEFASMHGFKSAQDMVSSVTDIASQIYVNPKERTTLIELIEQHGSVQRYECRSRRQDGSTFWISLDITPVRNNGALQYYQGFATNITERRTAEETLIASEKKYRAVSGMLRLICDNVPDMIWAKDLDKRYLFANQALCQKLLNAADTNEPVGNNDMFFALRERARHPENPDWHTFGEICAETDQIMLDTGKAMQFDEYGNIQGKFLFLDVRKAPLLDEQGVLIGTVGTARDVTEYRRIDDELRTQNCLQKMLMDIAAMYINMPVEQLDETLTSSLGRLGEFVNADRAYLFEYHFNRGICTNTHEWCAPGITPQITDLQAVPLHMMAKCVEDHRRGEIHIISDASAFPPDTPERLILEPQGIKSLITVPLMHDDHPSGFIGFDFVTQTRNFSVIECQLLIFFAQMITNVRKRRDLESTLRLAREHAESANKAKSEFLANMSHEIRTPLNGMSGMLQLMRTTSLDEEQQEYITTALQACSRLTRLLADILDLARIEAGKIPIQLAPMRLRDVVSQICALFEPMAKTSNLQLHWKVDPLIPAVVMGDATRVQQILTNIVGNALKFTPDGEVSLQIDALSSCKPGQCRILITVADTGIGIADHQLATLFHPFVQASGGYTRTYQGAGLGLSICKRLVDVMGGNISVVSEPGAGTSVHVALSFPLPISDETTTIGPANAQPALGGLKILAAEDDPISILSLDMLLKKHGAMVAQATTGADVLNLLRLHPFDLVLMDVQMPEMDGVSATRAIRRGDAGRDHVNIPILAMTAYAMPGDREVFLDAGMDGYLSKPFDIMDLVQAIADVLTARQRV